MHIIIASLIIVIIKHTQTNQLIFRFKKNISI